MSAKQPNPPPGEPGYTGPPQVKPEPPPPPPERDTGYRVRDAGFGRCTPPEDTYCVRNDLRSPNRPGECRRRRFLWWTWIKHCYHGAYVREAIPGAYCEAIVDCYKRRCCRCGHVDLIKVPPCPY